MRDLMADWKKWSFGERLLALVLDAGTDRVADARASHRHPALSGDSG